MTAAWVPSEAMVAAAQQASAAYRAECEAARQVESQRVFGHTGASIPSAHPSWDVEAGLMLMAAQPLIEAEVRERVAREIEAEATSETNRLEWDGSPGLVGNWIGGFIDAARIARTVDNHDQAADRG